MTKKTTRKKRSKAEQIPYDDSFKQLMSETLPPLGLKVIEEPKLGKLPLKADLVLITRQKSSSFDSSLKLFIKSGKPVQEIFRSMLKSEQTEEVKKAAITVMKLIHPLDAKEVLEQMSLVQERKELEEWALGLTKEAREKEKLENMKTVARQMKADGMSIANISKYTNLSEEEIEKI